MTITHSKPDAQGNYTISQHGKPIGSAWKNSKGFGYSAYGDPECSNHPTMAALKAALANIFAPVSTGTIKLVREDNFTSERFGYSGRYLIVNSATANDPMKRVFGEGFVFERTDGTFDRSHSQMDRGFEKKNFATLEEIIASIEAFENSEEKIWAEFDDLITRLSPENLCCDGEISRGQVNKRRAQINREWKALEQKLGRTVSEKEAEDHCYAKYRTAA